MKVPFMRQRERKNEQEDFGDAIRKRECSGFKICSFFYRGSEWIIGLGVKHGEHEKCYSKVFFDKNSLEHASGGFTNHIKMGMANSRYFLIILGKGAFDRSFRDGKGKIDVFYNEILYAKEKCFKEDRENRIFVCCLEKFDCKSIPDSNSNEGDKKKIQMIKEIADRYQRIGAKGKDSSKIGHVDILKIGLVYIVCPWYNKKVNKR